VKEILATGTNLGKVNLASTSAFLPLQFTFVTAGTGISSSVLTQGATGLDFADAGTGSCTTNGTSYTYSAGDICTVNVAFTPRYAGLRLGAVQVFSAENGDVLATAPIYGIGVGAQIGFASGAQAVVGRDLGQTIGVAVDGAGDLFIGDATNGRVVEAPVGGGPQATVATGLDNPGEIAVDGAGDVFIADANNARVVELPAGGAPQTTVGSGLVAPYGVAVDGAGDVFISDFNNNKVVDVPGNGSAQITVVTGLTLPKGIALDGAGDIFIANDGGGNVLEAPAGGGSLKAVGSGFSEPQAVAVDAAGDVFVADEGNSSLVEVPAGGGAQILLGNGEFNGPEGVAVDAAGNLFVADTFNDRVVELPFSLPPSVVFSSGGGTQTVTLESIGNLPLALPGIEQETNPTISDSSFVLNTTGATACAVVTASAAIPGTLTPGFTCALPINFSPTNGGTQSGTLVLTDNSLNASPTVFTSQTIPLSGTANANLPAITWASPAAISYGTALSATQLNATANVPGSFSYNPAAGTQLGAGTHTLSVTFTPTNTTSYTTASTTVTLTVNQAVPAIAWATPAAITYGTPLSATQLDATSPVAGTFVYSPPAGTGLTAGSQTLSVTFTPTDTTDYTTATATVQLTVEPATLAALTTPTPGSTLAGSSVTFTWTAGAGVTEYELLLGTTGVASANLYTSGHTTATSVNVTGLPEVGVKVYARLLSEIAGAWQSVDYTYTESGTPVLPVLTTPAPGSVLSGPSVAFTWTAGAGPAAYQLWLGTTGVGSQNLYDSGATTATTETVSGLPANGAPVYARLWWEISGVWQSADYIYFEAGTPVPPALITPVPGRILSGSTVAFAWTPSAGVTDYQLWLGSTGVGAQNLYDSGATKATTVTVSGLPTNGVTLYARLWWEVSGVWTSADYTYTEAGTPVLPVLTTPTPGSVLSGSSVAFTWTAGAGPVAYQLYLGTTGVGSHNLYESGSTTATTVTVNNLPTYGVTVYARLWWEIDAAWKSADYTYTESGAPVLPVLTTPAPGSVLSGSSVAFTWTAGGGPSSYQLYLGTTGVGSHNLYESGATTATTVTVNNLPTNGVTVYARFWWEIGGAWNSADYTYTEAGTPVLPVLTTPAPGSVLSGSSVAFTWTAGAGPVAYQLYLGTAGVGSHNLYASGATTATTETVSDLPTTGVTVYARFWWKIDEVWQSADYTYTAQ
jgi:hypothetical protein